MTAKLATLGYQLQQLYRDTDELSRAVCHQPVKVVKDLQAYRRVELPEAAALNGSWAFEHLPVPAGSWVTVATVSNQGFNGVHVFAHFDGWTLDAHVDHVASYVD